MKFKIQLETGEWQEWENLPPHPVVFNGVRAVNDRNHSLCREVQYKLLELEMCLKEDGHVLEYNAVTELRVLASKIQHLWDPESCWYQHRVLRGGAR